MSYLSISQAAKILGISTQTLRRWDKSGKFKSTRHPINNYRVYEKELVVKLAIEIESQAIGNRKGKLENYKPFYKDGSGALYRVDAIEFLKTLPDNYCDLIFADPPYNIKKAQWDTFESQKEYIEWSMEWIKEARRVLTTRGSLYICGFSEILADLKWAATPYFKGCKWLVWYYRNKANLGNDWGRSHESILHFRKSKDFIFNIDEVRIPYNAHTLKYPKRSQGESSNFNNGKKYDWSPNPLGAKPKDVIEIPTIANKAWERYPHPTQKPVELLRKIILSSSYKDSLVIDPFGGSGTTYAVAKAYGRSWLGSEQESEYCQVIKERLSDTNHIERITSERDQIEAEKRQSKIRG